MNNGVWLSLNESHHRPSRSKTNVSTLYLGALPSTTIAKRHFPQWRHQSSVWLRQASTCFIGFKVRAQHWKKHVFLFIISLKIASNILRGYRHVTGQLATGRLQKGAWPRTRDSWLLMTLTAQPPSPGYRGTGVVRKHNGWGTHCVYTSLYSSNYTPIQAQWVCDTSIKSTPVQLCSPSPCLLHKRASLLLGGLGWVISQFVHLHSHVLKAW